MFVSAAPWMWRKEIGAAGSHVVDAERARLARRGDEDVGRLAHEPVRHDHPVRVTRREDARRVHVVLARHLLHELPEERDVVDVLVHRGAAADAAVPRPQLILAAARCRCRRDTRRGSGSPPRSRRTRSAVRTGDRCPYRRAARRAVAPVRRRGVTPGTYRCAVRVRPSGVVTVRSRVVPAGATAGATGAVVEVVAVVVGAVVADAVGAGAIVRGTRARDQSGGEHHGDDPGPEPANGRAEFGHRDSIDADPGNGQEPRRGRHRPEWSRAPRPDARRDGRGRPPRDRGRHARSRARRAGRARGRGRGARHARRHVRPAGRRRVRQGQQRRRRRRRGRACCGGVASGSTCSRLDDDVRPRRVRPRARARRPVRRRDVRHRLPRYARRTGRDGRGRHACGARCRTLAVDIPSGVDGATGEVRGRRGARRRDRLLRRLKPGLLFEPGRSPRRARARRRHRHRCRRAGDRRCAERRRPRACPRRDASGAQVVVRADGVRWIDRHDSARRCWRLVPARAPAPAWSCAALPGHEAAAAVRPGPRSSTRALPATERRPPRRGRGAARAQGHGSVPRARRRSRPRSRRPRRRPRLAGSSPEAPIPVVVDADALERARRRRVAAAGPPRRRPPAGDPHSPRGRVRAARGASGRAPIGSTAARELAARDRTRSSLLKGPGTVVATPDGQRTRQPHRRPPRSRRRAPATSSPASSAGCSRTASTPATRR